MVISSLFSRSLASYCWCCLRFALSIVPVRILPSITIGRVPCAVVLNKTLVAPHAGDTFSVKSSGSVLLSTYPRNWKIAMVASYVLQTDYRVIHGTWDRSRHRLLYESWEADTNIAPLLICAVLRCECPICTVYTLNWVSSRMSIICYSQISISIHIWNWEFRLGFTAIPGRGTPGGRGEWSTDLQLTALLFLCCCC